jgi:ubiquinone/menaquinone biosynthesis C-methylase UbiE
MLPKPAVTHLFDGHEVSQAYAKYRFVIDRAVLDHVKDYYGECLDVDRCARVVDVGCGPGNNTVVLRDVFPLALVTGVDVSSSAIAFANKLHPNVPNVQFRNANVNVDGLPFDDASVDVVISITAIHWMNIATVMREVQRVLRPGGVLALTSSSYIRYRIEPSGGLTDAQAQTMDDQNTMLWDYLLEHDYASSCLRLLFNNYDDIAMPYPQNAVRLNEHNTPKMIMSRKITFADFRNYVHTFSAVRNYLHAEPDGQRVEQYFDSIFALLPPGTDDTTELDFVTPYFLSMTRKPL